MFSAGYTHKNARHKRSVRSRTISDYSPFGVLLPERTIKNEFFRLGFNGMESDEEVKGEGNSYTTEFRQYDTRIGRWLAPDPLGSKAPGWNPYRFGFDNPILFTDEDGLFENKKDAKAYKKEHDINGNIKYNKQDGIWEIKTKEFTFFKGDDLGLTEDKRYKNDGVIQSIIAKPKQFAMRIIMTEHIHYINNQSFWQWVAGVDNYLKGNSTWTYGIEFKTKDGNWNGNTANPVKLKDADKVITLYWDDVSELSEVLGALGQDPKVGNWREQAENLVHDEQNKGKNWDETENRKPALKKQDSSKLEDTIISINQWERKSYVTTNHSKDTIVKKSDVRKIKRDRIWRGQN